MGYLGVGCTSEQYQLARRKWSSKSCILNFLLGVNAKCTDNSHHGTQVLNPPRRIPRRPGPGPLQMLHLALLPLRKVLLFRIPVPMQPDLIPRQGKQPVHALERAPRRLRHTDPDPHPTDDGDGGEIPERPVGVDPARRNREEHVRHPRASCRTGWRNAAS